MVATGFFTEMSNSKRSWIRITQGGDKIRIGDYLRTAYQFDSSDQIQGWGRQLNDVT